MSNKAGRFNHIFEPWSGRISWRWLSTSVEAATATEQRCIEVCQDRKAQFADAQDYEDAVALARNAQRRADGLVSLMRKLALIRPREAQWEPCLRGLQEEVRGALPAGDVRAPATPPAKP